MIMANERICTIPLGDAYRAPRTKRTPRAVKLLRQYVTKHMKARGMRVIMSNKLNELLWARSIQKPPRRVKVRLIKEEEAVRAYLSDEKIEESKAEEKKEEKEIPKKEEKPREAEKKPESREEPKAEKKEEKK